MKVTFAVNQKSVYLGLGRVVHGEVVTCEDYPTTPFLVVNDNEGVNRLINLEAGRYADDGWVSKTEWRVRDAELTIK